MFKLWAITLCGTAFAFLGPVPQRTALDARGGRTLRRPGSECAQCAARRQPGALAMRAELPRGSLVALVTPMTSTGAVDVETLRELLRWHVQAGTDGLVVLGTTGEASTLSSKERELVLTVTREEAGSHMHITAGTGAVAPDAAVANAEQAKACGADACLVVTPYYVKPTQAGLIKFYDYVASKTELPMVLYNVPGRTGVDMKPETIALASEANALIAGVKEATGDVARVKALRERCSPAFRLYSGDDATASEFVLLGGDGVISVTANVAPDVMHSVMKAALDRDAAAVKRLEEPIIPLHNKLFVQSNPIPTKWALKRMGKLADGSVRLPLTILEASYEKDVEEALQVAKLV